MRDPVEPSSVAGQLALMLAANHMAAALEFVLPLVREQYKEFHALTLFGGDTSEAQVEADRWLEAKMRIECALKQATKKPSATTTDRLLKMPRRAR